MTAASDITSRTLLKVRSHLDGLPLCFSFSRDRLHHPALLLPGFLFVVLIYLALLRFRNLKQDHVHTRAALQALVAVLVPTCSLWPSRYLKLANVTHSRIDIPLEVIIKDTINGVIEVRNPSDDLADLMDSGSTVKGHTICINIGWKMGIKYFGWWMLSQSKSGRSGWSCRNMPGAHSSDPSPNTFPLASPTPRPLLCLDCLPHDKIPKLNAGSEVTLEFTAFSPSLRVFSTAQIISAIPFMMSECPRRRPRTVTSVVEELRASYDPTMVIDSISNVSVDYEHALRHLYKSFYGEERIRDARVKVGGINIWRQEMFLVALEAALVRRGWIERWAAQVTVK